MQLLVKDADGALSTYAVRHWPYLGWIDVATLLPVEGKPLGWRPHPFGRPPAGALPDSDIPQPREQVAADLARLFPDDEPADPTRR